MLNDLASKKCRLCEHGMGKLGPREMSELLTRIPDWSTKENQKISRRFTFKNFAEALAFVNKVGAIAESEGHHPDFLVTHGFPTLADSLPSSKGKQMFPRPPSCQGCLCSHQSTADFSFGWGYATITLFTHAVRGLSENDFILAAKIDNIPVSLVI